MINQINPTEISSTIARRTINPIDDRLVKRIQTDQYSGLLLDIDRALRIVLREMIWDDSHKLMRTSIADKTKLLKEG